MTSYPVTTAALQGLAAAWRGQRRPQLVRAAAVLEQAGEPAMAQDIRDLIAYLDLTPHHATPLEES